MILTPAILLDKSADSYKVAVDEVNSQLTYVGKSGDNCASASDPSWQVQRVYKVGSVTMRDYAASGAYSQVWDDRATLFTAPAFFNVISTEFNGTSAYVNMGNTHLYDVSNQFTMSFWVYIDNVASQRCIYSKTTNDANVYGINLQVGTNGKLLLQVRAPGYLTLHTGTAIVPTQAWVSIILTYAGGNNMSGFRLYVNGVVDSTPASAPLGATILLGQNAVLGSRAGSGFFLSGFLDEVTVWGIGFNSAEVANLYNGGSPTDPTTHSQAARLDSWYRMGDSDAYPTIADNAGTSDGTMVNMVPTNFVGDVP